jgi:nitrogen fixation NifU-like protein
MSGQDDLTRLYRHTVLEHSRNPHNHRRMPGATHRATGHNPLCGDKVTLYVRVGGDGRIDGAAFEATGCAISTASASMLTDLVRGRDAAGVRTLSAQVDAMLSGPDGVPELGDLNALGGVRAYPARVRCATLPWRTLEAALRGDAAPVSTE